MASNSSDTASILDDHGSHTEIVVLALTAISMAATLVLLMTRLCCKYVLPEAWRISLILQDLAYLLFGAGLVFFLAYMGTGTAGLCTAMGFFLLLGVMDVSCMLALTTISLLFLQNPGKLGQLSTFRKTWVVALVVPEKLVVFLLALTPVLPIDYFDTEAPYPVACFPVRQEGGKGAAFGAILFFILWVLQGLGLVLGLVCAFRLWKSNKSRIHASSPNLWQTEKIAQGRALQRMLLLEQLALLVFTFVLTVVVYTNSSRSLTPQWVVVVTAAVVALVHAGMCGVQLVLWSSACCCQAKQKSKEPYQKLKKLELIKVEGPGKLRLRASWSAGRGVTRRGLVKVYGLNQLKGWAQEIVVLGMLRKCQHASLLQCLWTANTNPYFENMTMLSGQIVTSESRLICLELTSSGNLQDFLTHLDVPLPEPCTRTILHDLAEGLASLHKQNILHRNLTSSAVYLKGSVQRLVLRAAVGDFEEAQIYGSLQNGTISSTTSKKQFFLPDIRAFALVALEMLGVVCQRRQQEKQPHHLITSPRTRPPSDRAAEAAGKPGDLSKGVAGKTHRAPDPPFSAPGAAEEVPGRDKASRGGGRMFVVGSTAGGGGGELRGTREGEEEEEEEDREGSDPGPILPPPSPFENEYMEVGDYGDEDSGTTSMGGGGYYPDSLDKPEDGDSTLPAITHVREAYKFEFPNQSVFKPQRDMDDDYEEIDDIEEEIHREIRYHALNRRREAAQTGGYIVTRTTSGRELFIPAQQHNTSFGNSDSGYVGTSSNSSRYPYSGGESAGAAGGMEDPPDLPTWPKAAHRTTSAQTISSFGDDILEVLPGMTDEDDLREGERSLRQMLRAREEAKVEQILEEYQHRLRSGGLSALEKDWPKLKFSRVMGSKGLAASGEGGRGSRPSTPRAQQQQEMNSPRPKTAAPGPGARDGTTGGKPADKGRPLSASVPGAAGAWKLRNSFKKSKARNELVRALSRGSSFARGPRPLSAHQRGSGGRLVEQKYAAHNAAFRHDEMDEAREAELDEDGYLKPRSVLNLPGQQPDEGKKDTATTREGESSAAQNDVLTSPGRSENAGDVQRARPVEPGVGDLRSQPQQTRQPEDGPGDQPPHSSPQQKAGGGVNVGKFSSFSSCDSMMSFDRAPHHHRDVSLTSGELTSLSSQADSVRAPSRDDRAPNLHEQDKKPGVVMVVPGMKIVDSGFDEDSASVVSDASCDVASPNVSGEACSCSCPSETATGSETCSCDCTQCRYSHSGSPQHSGWSESQSSCGTWSNSNSFSSYDVQMHRRKLPSTPKKEEHVLGPDEQYPVHPASAASVKPQSNPNPASPTRLSPPGRHNHRHHHHHHHHHRHHHPHSHSSSSTNSSAASRRYRELTKKGVPLRVTAVDEEASRSDRKLSSKHWSSGPGQRVATAEVIEEEEDGPDNSLFQDLDSQGFFESTDSASSKSSPTRQKRRAGPKRLEMVQGNHAGVDIPFNKFPDLPPISALEDIIREIPDETGDSCSGDETKAFLNRPESELSVKALKPPAPKPPPADCAPFGEGDVSVADLHREPQMVHDAELVIDRIFARAHPANSKGSETFVDPAMGLDETAIRELARLPPVKEVSDDHAFAAGHGDGAGDTRLSLLLGTDSKHVRYVHALSERVDLVSEQELLPADPRSFDRLRRRLLHIGSFGTIGLQLLDIVGSCWVKEAPPTTADIVDQLTDHVTETEL